MVSGCKVDISAKLEAMVRLAMVCFVKLQELIDIHNHILGDLTT